MVHPFSDLYVVSSAYGTYPSSDTNAFRLAACPNCGGTQMAVVAYQQNLHQRWLRCVNCNHAIVQNDNVTSPAPKPLTVPLGVSGEELVAWAEVRDCLAVGAYTAAVMMCRKLLFHLAVAHDLPEKNDKGFAPTYAAAVQHLEMEGLITKTMRPWVDRIKDVGNDANHLIPAVTQQQAMDVALFTEQLLRLTYEMKALIAQAETEPAPESQ